MFSSRKAIAAASLPAESSQSILFDMNTASPDLPPFLRLLAHAHRWKLVTALATSDLRVQELISRLAQPANLVSYHLRRLREESLVSEHRSSADARDVYYKLDLERLGALYAAAGRSLHPGLLRGHLTPEPIRLERPLPARVLFVCTHNSARSQMAEGFLRHLGGGRVEAWSAGTDPSRIHPLTLEAMAEHDIDLAAQSAKRLADFEGVRFDRVVTVCDRARETCPAFPGDPELCHWSVPDPLAAEGSRAAKRDAFRAAAREIEGRVRFLLAHLERGA
jgi:protein-tyrosine-phosphatase/DNA-binding transcriptional ArsR family regulator